MADTFRLTLAQLNPTVGAISANADKARAAWAEGKAAVLAVVGKAGSGTPAAANPAIRSWQLSQWPQGIPSGAGS